MILCTTDNKRAKCIWQKFLEIQRDIKESATVVGNFKISQYLTDQGNKRQVILGVSK